MSAETEPQSKGLSQINLLIGNTGVHNTTPRWRCPMFEVQPSQKDQRTSRPQKTPVTLFTAVGCGKKLGAYDHQRTACHERSSANCVPQRKGKAESHPPINSHFDGISTPSDHAQQLHDTRKTIEQRRDKL
ncbi:unnamed protein product [Ectocarpus sp. 12 AP-2014]